jgi:hypothetical protein
MKSIAVSKLAARRAVPLPGLLPRLTGRVNRGGAAHVLRARGTFDRWVVW